MEFEFNHPNLGGAGAPSPNTDNVASERLRKAIERNRAKQTKRAGASGPSATPIHAQRPAARPGPRAAAQSGPSWAPPGGNVPTRSSAGGNQVPATRRSVVKQQEESEFVTPIRQPAKKAPAAVGYTTRKSAPSSRRAPSRSTRKTGNKHGLISLWGHRLAWGFCVFLLIRLIFSGGGIMDFYNAKDELNLHRTEFNNIVQENKDIQHEILQIEKNGSYQRQIVRDHLGYIASDEFLILFPEKGSYSSN